MVVEFECPKCALTVSLEQYEKSRFCPDCGTFLRAKRLIIDRQQTKVDFKPKEIRREDVNVDSLFFEYMHLSPIGAWSGVSFMDVSSWISARKQAYLDFRKKFSPNKLDDLERIKKDFKE